MWFLNATAEHSELSSLDNLRLVELDIVTYNIRRLMKAHDTPYQFHHESPDFVRTLVVRQDPAPSVLPVWSAVFRLLSTSLAAPYEVLSSNCLIRAFPPSNAQPPWASRVRLIPVQVNGSTLSAIEIASLIPLK